MSPPRPLAHHVLPGNTADIAVFRYAVADLKKRFAVRQVAVVADRSVISEPLLDALNKDGMAILWDTLAVFSICQGSSYFRFGVRKLHRSIVAIAISIGHSIS